ncbi:MAG: acyl-CoA dehydrogenase [Chloroflexi bacterium]|nr:acyl-CoA dehydrogenase [Chloroflexota bacterium]
MDFEFTEEQRMLKKNVRDFLSKEIAPIVDERERHGPFTREEVVGFIKKLMPFGFYIGVLPKEYGGMELDRITMGVLNEELSRVWASLAATIGIAQLAPLNIADAPDELRQKFIPQILEGELIGCSAITEPNAGSDASHIETTAMLDGNTYVINGTKTWISNGTIADVCMLLAVTDKSKGPLGMSTILVEKAASPWESKELHKIGWRCFPTGEMYFTDYRVPKMNLLGDVATGYKRTMREFESARSGMAIMAAGICQAAIDASISYARERKQFGRPIGSFQLIQEMIADMIAETEAARLLGYRAFCLIDKGVRARLESSLAKAYACEAAVRVTSKAIQIHGAVGLSDEYPVERYFRDARMLTIPDGATQIQKLIVGREAIGIKAFV